jgi:hypothetical protein
MRSQEKPMPWPFLLLAGAAKVAHTAAATVATKAAAGAVKGAAAKGAGAHKGAAHLPPGATTIAKEVAKRIADSRDDRDNDPGRNKDKR